MPAVRQKPSKLTATCCQASSTIAAGTTPADVIDFPMALLSFADSPPRAYWLKAGNAHLTFSTSPGAFPASALQAILFQWRSIDTPRQLLALWRTHLSRVQPVRKNQHIVTAPVCSYRHCERSEAISLPETLCGDKIAAAPAVGLQPT